MNIRNRVAAWTLCVLIGSAAAVCPDGSCYRLEKIKSLVEQLGHRDWHVRERAYTILRSINRPEAIRLLEKGLTSTNAETRYRAGILLKVKKYYLPEGSEQKIIPLLSAYRNETGERTERRLSVIHAVVSELKEDSVPLLLVMFGQGRPEIRKQVSALLREHLETWEKGILRGFGTLRPDDFRRLGEFPGSLYLMMNRYADCEKFLCNAAQYVEFVPLFQQFNSLERAHTAGNHIPVMFDRIVREIFRKYAAYFYTEDYSAEKALVLGNEIKRVSAKYNRSVFRSIVTVLAELGDEDALIGLVGDTFRKRDYARVKQIIRNIRPGTDKARYYFAYLAIMTDSGSGAYQAENSARLRKKHPGNQELHLSAALFLAALGRDLFAEKEYEVVLSTDPEISLPDFQACYHLARDMYMRREFKKAAELFKKVISTGTELQNRFDGNDRYNLLFRLGTYKEIASHYTIFCRAQLLIKGKKHDQALELLKPLEPKLRFDREVSFYNRGAGFDNLEYEILYGRLLMLAGREKEKKERVEKAYAFYLKQKDTYNSGHRTAYWYNNIAWYLIRTETNTDTALEYSRKSLELEPDTAVYLDTLAECYYVRGKTETAVEMIQRAIEHYESDSALIYFKTQLEKFKRDRSR